MKLFLNLTCEHDCEVVHGQVASMRHTGIGQQLEKVYSSLATLQRVLQS